MKTAKILLDTNVWSYLAQHALGDAFQAATVKSNAKIVVAPSVVQEALAIPDVPLRNAVTELQTRSRWTRLMPEAYLQCEEIKSEVQRARPDWLSGTPDLARFRRNKYDWTRTNQSRGSNLRKMGFWQRVRDQPDKMAEWFRAANLDEAREYARTARDRLRDIGDHRLPALDKAIAVTIDTRTGEVRDQRAEPWRVAGVQATTRHLLSMGDPYRDWLEPFLVPVWVTRPTDWDIFWIRDVTAGSMPRHWIRWAFEHLQQARSVSRGTPGDAQLGAYLFDADIVVSADRIFVDLVNQIQDHSPSPMATAVKIKGDASGLEHLLEIIRSQ
ncbi:hypothetical protein [Sphingobium chungangianum]